MTKPTDVPYRPAIWCVAVGLLTVVGCGGDTTRSESFETLTKADSLPDDWELRFDSGTYRAGATGDAREGNVAIAIAGSGGEARLIAAPIPLKSAEALTGSVWIKPNAFAPDSTAFVGVINAEQTTIGSEIPVKAEEWGEHYFTYAPQAGDAASSVRFFVRLTGEGLLAIDSVRQSIIKIDPQFLLKDGSFESPQDDGSFSEWRLAAAKPGWTANAYSKSPVDGSKCLRVKGEGEWCVITWPPIIPAADCRVRFRGYARATQGEAQLKIEYYQGDQQIDASYSELVTGEAWRPLYIESDPTLQANADTLRVSVVAQPNKNQKEGSTVVDFDKMQVLVVKP